MWCRARRSSKASSRNRLAATASTPPASRRCHCCAISNPRARLALIVVHPETKLRELVQIKLPFPASIHWRRGAFLRPVVEAMDENERYAVVLTDNQRARLFTVVMGELTEHEDLFSETGQRTRSLGADQMRAQKRHDQRHQEEIALHSKRVIDALHDLALRQPYDRLIVGGTPKAAGQLVRLLPTRLRGKLVDTVSMRLGGSHKEILNKILAVQQRMERDREKEIVEGVLAELHDRGKAVAGLAAVLDAVNQGRVWTLVYGKDFTAKAGECSECSAYSPHPKGPCVYCGEDVHPLPQMRRPPQPVGPRDGRPGRGRRRRRQEKARQAGWYCGDFAVLTDTLKFLLSVQNFQGTMCS